MTYRLNLYSDKKLISTELLNSGLDEASRSACVALDKTQAHRAEVIDSDGAVRFSRWAVL